MNTLFNCLLMIPVAAVLAVVIGIPLFLIAGRAYKKIDALTPEGTHDY